MKDGAFTGDQGGGLSLAWLIRLRWITAAAQSSAILVASRLLPDELPVTVLLSIVAFGALSNVILSVGLRKAAWLPTTLPGLVLGLDVLLLTALLYASGGPSNPFTAIYLVHITLVAVVLRGLWAWVLGLLSTACFGLLFFWHLPVHSLGHMGHGNGGMSLHLTGMWIAFAITAGLIAAFVGRVTELLRQRDTELAALRDLSARQARLAALTTLAAGVAHELGTPLGTIAVAAGELQREAETLGPIGAEIRQDADLIRQEAGRCRRILDQLAEPTGATVGEAFQDLAWPDFEADLKEGLVEPDLARVVFHWPGEGGALPRRGLARAAKALIINALEAAPEPAIVAIQVTKIGPVWSLTVTDKGRGMTPAVLARVGEPFFTTKPPGAAMGLGLFLARTFAEQLGGTLELHSEEGRGTRITLSWSQVPRA